MRRLNDKKGAAVLIWILAAVTLAMALLIVIPIILDVDGSRAKAQDEAHERTARDSAMLERVVGNGFEAVYDYHEKKFVALTDHPYKVEPYGCMKEHEDCVILVKADGQGSVSTTWISRSLLRERYR